MKCILVSYSMSVPVVYGNICHHSKFQFGVWEYVSKSQKWPDHTDVQFKMKWNESGFRSHLCTYRLNWVRRTSWGWWDDWDDTVLQTQDSEFEPWWSEAEHATSRSRRFPTILTFTRGLGRNIFLFLSNRRDREPNSGVKGSGANHYPGAPAHVQFQNGPILRTKLLYQNNNN